MPLIPTQTKKKYLTNSEPQLWNIQSQGLKFQCTRLSEGLGTNHVAQQIHTWQRRGAAVKEPSAFLKVILTSSSESLHPGQVRYPYVKSHSMTHWFTKTNE